MCSLGVGFLKDALVTFVSEWQIYLKGNTGREGVSWPTVSEGCLVLIVGKAEGVSITVGQEAK